MQALATSARRALLLIALSALAVAAGAQSQTLESLQAVQQRVEALEPSLIRSTVALRLGGVSGSGVIISPDGFVLTAAHVIRDSRSRHCFAILSDGRRLPATVLGSDPDYDTGIVKIEGVTDLPAAPLGDSSTLRPGQWVLATGHPLGPRAGRPPVLRIGRVMGRPGSRPGRPMRRVITDAPIISGDSGGPLFDLNGRVVGIHSMITEGRRRMTSIHIPVNLPKSELAQMEAGDDPQSRDPKAGEYFTAYREAEDALASGDAAAAVRSAQRSADLDPSSATARFLLARALAKSGDRARAASALADACDRGFSDAAAVRADPALGTLAHEPVVAAALGRLDTINAIPGATKDDESLLTAVARSERGLGSGIVKVRAGDTDVALGTVMSAGGDILTKASELPSGALTCVLPDGKSVPAESVAADSSWDVALLRVKGQRLTPAALAESAPVGIWTVSPAADGSVAALGVVGVADMPVIGRGISPRATSKAYMGVMLAPLDSAALREHGVEHGVGVEVEPDMPAAKAGMRTGDVVVAVDGQSVADPDGFMDYMLKKKPGDTVAIKMVRGRDPMNLTINLGQRPGGLPGRGGLPEFLSGDVSHMQGPFPHVIHHDSVLPPNAMGGPLLDMDGRCIGVNIARADRASTYAIPSAMVRDIYQRLASQK